MAESDAQICNLALARIGNTSSIDDLDENTNPARACKAIFGLDRDAVLASHEWGFATRRKELALLSDESRDGWEYVYSLPTDIIKARHIWPGTRNPRDDQKVAFDIELAGDVTEASDTLASVLLTDEDEPVLVYTARITNPALFSALFVDSLAWMLAADLALALAKKPAIEAQMRQRYELSLSRAKMVDLSGQKKDPQPTPAHIAGRG